VGVTRLAVVIMPRCEGIPSGPCPKNANNKNVKHCQGDLFLCKSCEDSRFPPLPLPSVPSVPCKKASDIDSGTPCKACAPLFAKLQQQISDLWNAHKKLAAEVTEIKCVAGNIQQSAVKSDEHVKLAVELSEMKTVVSRLSEEQHAGNAPHIEELNLTANVCKTLNDMNKRKKNVVVTGLPEVALGTSDSDETKRLDEIAFTTFCEENLTVKPVLSKLGCRQCQCFRCYIEHSWATTVCLASLLHVMVYRRVTCQCTLSMPQVLPNLTLFSYFLLISLLTIYT